ncbi:uncharacterized protein TNCT_128361 [Trichonephila clavata]|uniref:Uncharacterized protein n=1 Tax=Trichonephila clavata TaxID=2740835 RepID=A0A8X6LBL4_TRICU|nr:uncharacterized protein TNCT_128361 [Trichonephila clavata]
MRRVSHHIVPGLLTTEQKEERMTISGDLIDTANKVPRFLNHIITGEDLFDIQLKRGSSTWKLPGLMLLKKFRQNRSKGMMEVFFDPQGILHPEFIPEDRTINKEHYVFYDANGLSSGRVSTGTFCKTTHQHIDPNW